MIVLYVALCGAAFTWWVKTRSTSDATTPTNDASGVQADDTERRNAAAVTLRWTALDEKQLVRLLAASAPSGPE